MGHRASFLGQAKRFQAQFPDGTFSNKFFVGVLTLPPPMQSFERREFKVSQTRKPVENTMRIVFGTKLRPKICDGTAEFLVLLRLPLEISIISAYSVEEKKGKNVVDGSFGYYVCDAAVNINKPCSDEDYLHIIM